MSLKSSKPPKQQTADSLTKVDNSNELSTTVAVNIQAPWLYHIHPAILSSLVLKNTTITENTASLLSLDNLADKLNQLTSQIHPNGLTTGMGKPLTFVPQSVLDDVNKQLESQAEKSTSSAPIPTTPIAYESHIAETGQIPTRDNLHDLFNACVWLTFPKTKAMLNRQQAEQIAKEGISGSRGRIRDAITLLDENGAILLTSDENIATALKVFDWEHCLVKPRNLWLDVQMEHLQWTSCHNQQASLQARQALAYKASVMICGHALLEQLVQPRKPLCAHTFIVKVEDDFFSLPIEQQIATVDSQLSQALENWLLQDDLSSRQLCPLPILGVPHFCEDNANAEYYQDSYVFRSGRRGKKGQDKKEQK